MDIRKSIIFVIGWGFLVYIIATKLNSAAYIEHSITTKRINKVLKQLYNSSKGNMQIFTFIEYYLNNSYKLQGNLLQKIFIEKMEYELDNVASVLDGKKDLNSFYGDIQLSPDYLQLRSRIKQNTQEMWNYFSSEIRKIRKIPVTITQAIVLELGVEYKRSIISNIDAMRSVDGYEIWLKTEAEILSNFVQRRFHYIQNPKDCKNTKKLLCQLRECGLGCELRALMYCLIVAYATKRTVVLTSYDLIYNVVGWEEIFQPFSKTCTAYDLKWSERWKELKDTKLVPDINLIKWKPSYISLAVPEDLLPRIMKLHSHPSLWWMSQFVKYLFKPKREEILALRMEILDWKKPIVGVHIRRTDKDTEVAFYSVDEYMTFVEDYFLTLEIYNKNVQRRIFLATDEPQVITEVRLKYPQYKILSDLNVAKIANVSTRSTVASLNGVISDILILSLTDFLVCTFSSNVCRTAYEIMQNYYPDASDRFISLDDIYYFIATKETNVEAILSHKARNKDEMSIIPGDVINILGKNWNGFFSGNNERTDKNGLFPSFKVKEKIKTVNLPTYLGID